MKLNLAAAAVLAGLAWGSGLAAQQMPFTANVVQFNLPDDIHLGEVAGVARNSRGDIFVYTRTGNPVVTIGSARAVSHGGSALLSFEPNGNFRREIGQGAYGILVAQQVRVDPQDNVWIVDQLSNQVIKFDPNGRIQMILGRKPEAMAVPATTPANPGAGTGAEGESFNRPTDVAWDAAGNIYVSDGYGNARVAKYDRNGKWIRNWGSRGNGQGQFDGASGIAVDAQGNVYVADRGNGRVQVFDGDGNFRTQITGLGTPGAICISPGPRQLLFVSNSNPTNNIDIAGDIIVMELGGRIIGRFGRAGKPVGEFGTVNAIDCRNPNELLVGEIGNWRVQRVALDPNQLR